MSDTGLEIPLTIENEATEWINPNGEFPLSLNVPGTLVVGGKTDAGLVANGITAHAGGGQASAEQLGYGTSRVTVVASAADSVALPAAVAGYSCWVINAATANSLDVYTEATPGTDVINALADTAAFAIPAGKSCQFTCAVNGTWNTLLSD